MTASLPFVSRRLPYQQLLLQVHGHLGLRQRVCSTSHPALAGRFYRGPFGYGRWCPDQLINMSYICVTMSHCSSCGLTSPRVGFIEEKW